MRKEKISIVVPCYNEDKCLNIFYKEVKLNLDKIKNIKYEILFINDGSTDKTLEIIKDLSKKDKCVKFISFSRNFGKESAIYAGLINSTGDYVAIMDADLQDPPSLLVTMFKLIKEDYDVVATRRVTRSGEPLIRSFFSRMFYKIINKMSNIEMVDGARDYRLMKRQVVNAILELKEYNRYSKGIFSFVGFKTKWLEYENVKRVAGETKWSFYKLFKYAIEGITAFSTIPLMFSALIGSILFLISLIFIIIIIFKTLIFGDPVSGWPSLACIILFLSGIQLFSIGVIGQYLSKTYLETKNRPIYIIKETNIN